MEQAIASFAKMLLFAVIAAFICFAVWIWMLIDCIRNKEIEGSEKAIWIAIVLFGSFVGGLVYFFAKKNDDAILCLKIFFITTITVTSVVVVFNGVSILLAKYNIQSDSKRLSKIENKLKLYDQKTANNNKHDNQSQEPRPYKPLKQSPTDKALVDPRDELAKSKYLLLNKNDQNRRAARTPQEVANINTAKYSQKIDSWIDSAGNVHFSNAALQPAIK